MEVGKLELCRVQKTFQRKMDLLIAVSMHPKNSKQQKNKFSRASEGCCSYRCISKNILICLKMSKLVVKSEVIIAQESFLLFH